MIDAFIRDRGGVVERATLIQAGFSSYAIGRARHSGSIFRVRRAWFAIPDAHPELVQAVRVGGALSCVSVLRHRGVWLPDDLRVHVAVPRTASRLRSPHSPSVRLAEDRSGVVVHWSPAGVRPSAPTDRIAAGLAHATTCLAPEFAIAAVDSALNLALTGLDELTAAFAQFPARSRAMLRLVDVGSQSGLETIVRLRLRSLRVRYASQVPIGNVGRVDLLVGDRLVIELDGRAFHATGESFESDRRRDLELQRLGYRIIRLSYRQVLFEWEATEAALLEIIRRGEHLGTPIPLQDHSRVDRI